MKNHAPPGSPCRQVAKKSPVTGVFESRVGVNRAVGLFETGGQIESHMNLLCLRWKGRKTMHGGICEHGGQVFYDQPLGVTKKSHHPVDWGDKGKGSCFSFIHEQVMPSPGLVVDTSLHVGSKVVGTRRPADKDNPGGTLQMSDGREKHQGVAQGRRSDNENLHFTAPNQVL